jgi:hypothetical protein
LEDAHINPLLSLHKEVISRIEIPYMEFTLLNFTLEEKEANEIRKRRAAKNFDFIKAIFKSKNPCCYR